MPPAGGTRRESIAALRGKQRVVYVGATADDPELRYGRSNPCRQYAAWTERMQHRENELMQHFERNIGQTANAGGLNNDRNQDGSLRRSAQDDVGGWVYVLALPDGNGQHGDNNQTQRGVGARAGEDDDLQRALELSRLEAQEEERALAAGIAASLEPSAGAAASSSSTSAGSSSNAAGPTSLGDCTICMCDMGSDERTTQLSCGGGHRFHTACVTRWLRDHQTCPNCRERVPGPGHVAAPARRQPPTPAPAATTANRPVGTLDRTARTVYERRDGTYWYNAPNDRGSGYHRERVHGNLHWTRHDGTEMRGSAERH